LGVRRRRPHPNVEIFGGSDVAVNGEGMSDDDEKLSVGGVQLGKQISEVSVHHRLTSPYMLALAPKRRRAVALTSSHLGKGLPGEELEP
jgi:hypothetical protein